MFPPYTCDSCTTAVAVLASPCCCANTVSAPTWRHAPPNSGYSPARRRACGSTPPHLRYIAGGRRCAKEGSTVVMAPRMVMVAATQCHGSRLPSAMFTARTPTAAQARARA